MLISHICKSFQCFWFVKYFCGWKFFWFSDFFFGYPWWRTEISCSWGTGGIILIFFSLFLYLGMPGEMSISVLRIWCREGLLSERSIGRNIGFVQPTWRLGGVSLVLHLDTHSGCLMRCHSWCEITGFSRCSQMAKCNINTSITVLFCGFFHLFVWVYFSCFDSCSSSQSRSVEGNPGI